MAELLVSVRSAAEAALVLERIVYVDVKEPENGALGRASTRVLREVVGVVESRPAVTVSAALGELVDMRDDNWQPCTGVDLYKVGLSGCCGLDWEARLDRFRRRLAGSRASLVVVAYADASLAEAPPPWDVLEYAVRHRQSFFLVDTFDKPAGQLVDWLGRAEIDRLIVEAHAAGVRVALAGSLRERDIATLVPLDPDVLAVRGAACVRGDRRRGLDLGRVDSLVKLAAGARV